MTQNNDTRDIVGTVAHMKKHGSLKILIIALALGAILFLVGSVALDGNEGKKESNDDEKNELIGFFEYKSLLEEEIESVCMGISGVRNVSAVVFFSEVGGSMYAQNSQSGGTAGNQKNEYVIKNLVFGA